MSVSPRGADGGGVAAGGGAVGAAGGGGAGGAGEAPFRPGTVTIAAHRGHFTRRPAERARAFKRMPQAQFHRASRSSSSGEGTWSMAWQSGH